MSQDIKIIQQKVLERIFKDNKINGSDTRFIFLLGAGSSVQSGIKSAYTLAKEWIEDIKEDLGKEYDTWVKKDAINENDLASSYTKIYNKRFEHNPINGYETLQKLMENKEPSVGYTILSQILEQTNHNFIVTTNFDSLIEDALFLFTSKRPLVCGHESLADFIQLNSTRPTIIKVHRDILLNPYNTPKSTSSMNEPLEKALKPIIENSPIVIIGYGGHDESIMKLLREPKRQAVYWCVRDTDNISDNIKSVLNNDADRVVKIEGFDEFMVALQSQVYNFESIKSLSNDDENRSLIVQNALKKVKSYKKELDKFKEEVTLSDSDEFKENSKSILPSWWDYELEVRKEADNDKKNTRYLEGLKAHKNSHELMENYAIFLDELIKDYDNAEEYYLKALKLEPNNAIYNGNYADFLNDVRENYENAEKYYLKSLELESNNPSYNGNYANLLNNVREDYENAEKYYLKALELEPNSANYNGNYASFLLTQNRKEEAIKYLESAFKLSSDKKDLLTELWFYKLAHFQNDYKEAKIELDKLLKDGAKSKGWKFTSNIKQAIRDKHQDVSELKEYAQKISGIDYSNVGIQ